jgi:hypothetical protein
MKRAIANRNTRGLQRRREMKVKVSEANDQVLDYLVAQAMGMKIYRSKSGRWMRANYGEFNHRHGTPWFEPTRNWGYGGLIIELEKIALDTIREEWLATRIEGSAISEAIGPRPLIAVMRCYVAVS